MSLGQNKMCRDKRAYKSERHAIRAALGSSKNFGKPMRWYHCPICGKWHLTSQMR